MSAHYKNIHDLFIYDIIGKYIYSDISDKHGSVTAELTTSYIFIFSSSKYTPAKMIMDPSLLM